MREKVVLPKFRVPGMRSHWAMRLLWIVGGLVLVQMGVFALIIMRQPGAEASDAIAPRAPVAASSPAAAPAKALAQDPAKPSAKTPEAPPATPTATASASDAPVRGKRLRRHSYRHARRSSAASGKALAKAGGPSKKSKKPDAVDELLKRFK
jgi:type IV secretory pathway VirB10-like protein